MSETIIDGTGSGNYWRINNSGAGLVVLDAPVVIGSVSVAVDTIYVQSGVTFVDTRDPLDNSYNPATQLKWSGTELAQVVMSDATGSSVQDITFSGGVLVTAGSWY